MVVMIAGLNLNGLDRLNEWVKKQSHVRLIWLVAYHVLVRTQRVLIKDRRILVCPMFCLCNSTASRYNAYFCDIYVVESVMKMRETVEKTNATVGFSSDREQIVNQPQENLETDESWSSYSTKNFQSIIKMMEKYTEEQLEKQLNHHLYDEVVNCINELTRDSEIAHTHNSSVSFLHKCVHESIQQRSLARSIFNFLQPLNLSKPPSPKTGVKMHDSDLDEKEADCHDCEMIFGAID